MTPHGGLTIATTLVDVCVVSVDSCPSPACACTQPVTGCTSGYVEEGTTTVSFEFDDVCVEDKVRRRASTAVTTIGTKCNKASGYPSEGIVFTTVVP